MGARLCAYVYVCVYVCVSEGEFEHEGADVHHPRSCRYKRFTHRGFNPH
jgi:hypothetical protein